MTNSSAARRAAHTRLCSCTPTGASPAPPGARLPPYTYSAELVPLTAEPSGAGFSWMGVGFFLGILNQGKALPTPRERRPLLLPPSALSRARRAGPIRSQGPGDCFGEGGSRTARSRQRREAGGGLTGPLPYSPRARLGAQATEGVLRRRSSAAGDSLRLSLNLPVSRARAAPRSAHQSPAPTTTRESTAAAVAALLADPRSRPREGLEGGGGARKGKASPPHPGCCLFAHPLGSAPLPL